MIFISILLNILMGIGLFFSIKACFRFGGMLMNVEDNLQKCTDIMDKRYYNFVHMFDDTEGVYQNDPFVMNFLKEVHETRNDVLIIASHLAEATDENPIEKRLRAIASEEDNNNESALVVPEEEEQEESFFQKVFDMFFNYMSKETDGKRQKED